MDRQTMTEKDGRTHNTGFVQVWLDVEAISSSAYTSSGTGRTGILMPHLPQFPDRCAVTQKNV